MADRDSPTPPDDRFCPDCDVSLDLHFMEDDCEAADARARLVENWGVLR